MSAQDSKFWKDGKRTPQYRESLIGQTRLWMQGISVHNKFADECCPDFSCCRPDIGMPLEKRRERGLKMLQEFNDGDAQ